MYNGLRLVGFLLREIGLREISEWRMWVTRSEVVLPRFVVNVLGLKEHRLKVVFHNQS